MVVSIKTNAPKAVDQPTTKITPAGMFAVVLNSAKEARQAALYFVCSSVAYILSVNYFQDGDSKDFLSRKKAADHIKDELAKQGDIKHGMMDIYVSRADALVDLFVNVKSKSPTKLGIPVIKDMADMSKPEDASKYIFDYLNKNYKVESLRDLSRLLGYAVGEKRETTAAAPTAKSTIERVANVLKSVQTNIEEGKAGGATEKQVVKQVANSVSDPIALARAALERLMGMDNIEPDDIYALVDLCQKIADAVEAKYAASHPKKKAKAPVKKATTKAITKSATA